MVVIVPEDPLVEKPKLSAAGIIVIQVPLAHGQRQ